MSESYGNKKQNTYMQQKRYGMPLVPGEKKRKTKATLKATKHKVEKYIY